jgi:hypothetical protein
MRTARIPMFLVLGGAVVVGATVFGGSIAGADNPFTNVIIGNTTTNPVPVAVQNTDGAGNLKVHEQGTANVNVTNASLPVTMAQPAPISAGGGSTLVPAQSFHVVGVQTASALVIHMTAGVARLELDSGGGGVAASFQGPAGGGTDTTSLALSRPITFDAVLCAGGSPSSDLCTVSWIGNS